MSPRPWDFSSHFSAPQQSSHHEGLGPHLPQGLGHCPLSLPSAWLLLPALWLHLPTSQPCFSPAVSNSCCCVTNHSTLGGCKKPPFIWVTILRAGNLGWSELDLLVSPLLTRALSGEAIWDLACLGWPQLGQWGSAHMSSHPPSGQLSLFTWQWQGSARGQTVA